MLECSILFVFFISSFAYTFLRTDIIVPFAKWYNYDYESDIYDIFFIGYYSGYGGYILGKFLLLYLFYYRSKLAFENSIYAYSKSLNIALQLSLIIIPLIFLISFTIITIPSFRLFEIDFKNNDYNIFNMDKIYWGGLSSEEDSKSKIMTIMLIIGAAYMFVVNILILSLFVYRLYSLHKLSSILNKKPIHSALDKYYRPKSTDNNGMSRENTRDNTHTKTKSFYYSKSLATHNSHIRTTITINNNARNSTNSIVNNNSKDSKNAQTQLALFQDSSKNIRISNISSNNDNNRSHIID